MNTIIKKLLYFLFVFCASIVTGQDKPEYAVSLIDPALIKNADAVIRFEETRYIIESPREYIHQTSRVITVFDEESDESSVHVHYNKYSKADLISVVLYDASGKFLRKIKKSELMDHATYDGITILSDERVIVVRAPGGHLPYTVEYNWQITNHETMFYPNWQPQDAKESIEKATFVLDAPQELLIHTHALNHDFHFTKEIKDGRLIQKWTVSGKEAIAEDESGPPDHELFFMLLISPSFFQVEEYSGSMSDWKSFGAFLYELNKDREKMTPEMTKQILQMTAHCNTPKEQIDTLYHWLQKNMRYVSVQLGIGGWQAFDAAYVEKNRYGDCKALSTFMKGMLRVVGIESWQVIIYWDEKDNLFMDDFASPYFNHMMLHIPQENMWLECTSDYLPTGIIDRYEENKKVLLITPGGGKITTTPSSPSTLNQINTTNTFALSDKLVITGTERYTGNMQRAMRRLYHYSSSEEQREYFFEHFPLSIQKLDQFHVSTDRTGIESVMEYTATLSQFGSISGKRYFFPVNSIHPPPNSCSANTDRKTDFISKDDYTETNDIYISITPDYTIEYLPPPSNFSFQGNRYAVEIKVEDGLIHVHHQITKMPMRLTPEQYKEMCSYYTSVAKSNSRMIVLKKSRT